MYIIPLTGYAELGVQCIKTVSLIIFEFNNRKVIIHWKGDKVVLEDKMGSNKFFSMQVEDKFH